MKRNKIYRLELLGFYAIIGVFNGFALSGQLSLSILDVVGYYGLVLLPLFMGIMFVEKEKKEVVKNG